MKFPARIPFVETLGIELLRFEDGEAELALTLAAPLLNSWNVAHGGVLMTLLDVAMAHAARSRIGMPAEGPPLSFATVEMKTSFMRPGLGRLLVHGRVLTQTVSLSFCEASVRDAEGHLVAHATGTFKRLKAAPMGTRRVPSKPAD